MRWERPERNIILARSLATMEPRGADILPSWRRVEDVRFAGKKRIKFAIEFEIPTKLKDKKMTEQS